MKTTTPSAERPVADADQKRRLHWGLLELDQLLGGFLAPGYERSCLDQRRILAEPIQEGDQRLSDRFVGRSLTLDPR